MKLDRAGMLLSCGCLMHCLIPVLLPALAAWHSWTETAVHGTLLLMVVPVSGLAIFGAFRRGVPAWMICGGGLGLALLLAGGFRLLGEDSERPLTVAGALLLGFAHVANLRHAVFQSSRRASGDAL